MSRWYLLWNFDGTTPSGHKISMTSEKLTCLWSWQIFYITQITDCIRSVLNCDLFGSKISVNQEIHFRRPNLVLMSNVAVQTGQQKQKIKSNEVPLYQNDALWCYFQGIHLCIVCGTLTNLAMLKAMISSPVKPFGWLSSVKPLVFSIT